MSKLLDRIEELWCVHMHTATMWPFKGRYQCGVCLREFPVGFEARSERRPAVPFAGAEVAARRA